MGAGRIEIKHIFPSETDYVIWTLRKTDNLLTLVPATFFDGTTTTNNVTKFVYAAPHPESVMVLTNIDAGMYLVTPYRSSDGVTLDEQLDVQLAVDASTGAQYLTTTYEYVVNRGYNNTSPVNTGSEVWADPVDGQNELRDERLKDKSYQVVERGTSLLMAEEITNYADGGFDFATAGKNFEDGGVYFVIVQNRQDVPPIIGGGSSDFNDVVLMTASMTFDAALHTGKVIVAAYPGSDKVIQLAMPNLSLIPDCKFRIQTQGGTQDFLTMQLDTGDTVEVRGDDLNAVILGKGELIEVMVKSNVMYITSPLTGYEKLGQRIWGDKVELNTRRRDGTQYTQTNVPRLMQWIDSGVTTVTEAQWASSVVVDGKTIYPYKGFFARDDVAGTIRVPDDRNRFVRALLADTGDSERQTQGAGGYQIDKFKEHSHDVITTGDQAGVDPGRSLQRADNPGDGYSEGASVTGPYIEEAGGAETRPENTGLIPLICI